MLYNYRSYREIVLVASELSLAKLAKLPILPDLTMSATNITINNLTMPPENKGWADTKKVLAKRGLLEQMRAYQPEMMAPETMQLLQPCTHAKPHAYQGQGTCIACADLDNPLFMPAALKEQSRICEILCSWVRVSPVSYLLQFFSL